MNKSVLFRKVIVTTGLILWLTVVFRQSFVLADEGYPDPPPAAKKTHVVETTFLPTGDLFKPLLASAKEPAFYLGYRKYSIQNESINVASGAYGEIFGLYRRIGGEDGSGWQVNFGGSIHSLFNLDAHSFALVTTDYTIGFPCTFRKGADSFRLSLYHQSSHLGDEFLLQTKTERIEISYEALNFIGSHEWREWRAYYGGEYMIHKAPGTLRPASLQAGMEYYGADAIVGRGRLVGGLDLISSQEHDWEMLSSLKLGLQFDSSTPNGRYLRVLAEGYTGFHQDGQFILYSSRISYYGIGIFLGFE